MDLHHYATAPVLSFAASGAGLVKGGRLVFLFPEHHSGTSGSSGAGTATGGGGGGGGGGAQPPTADVGSGTGGGGGDNVYGDGGARSSGGGYGGGDIVYEVDGASASVSISGGGGGGGGADEETLIRQLAAGRPGVARVAPFLPRHRLLRLVSVCAQEFKGMSRHAVVMERV